MTVIKYTGNGLISQSIHFNPKFNDGLYEVTAEVASYLLKTFPKDFTLIEKKSKEVKETKEDKPAAKKPTRRKKKVEEPTKEA
jgi:hypothetical protein